MYKSEQRYINEKLLTRNARARTHTHGISLVILNRSKKSSLPSRLILRRRLIRVYSVCSQEFLSKLKKLITTPDAL